MEITITRQKITTEKSVLNIKVPFYFHINSVYQTDSDSYYDQEENIWGIVYSAKNCIDDDVLKATTFNQSNREMDDDESNRRYGIKCFNCFSQSEKENIEYWLEHQCTQEEFERESSRIFKSITNQ